MKLYNFLLLFIPVCTGLNAQLIVGPDEVPVDSTVKYYNTAGQGGTTYYWLVPLADITQEDEDSITLSWDSDGFYKVQLWQDRASPQEDTLLEEKPVVAGSPPMFDYAYEAAGNRISREIIYYQSQGKKSTKISDPWKLPEEITPGGFKVYPNPTEEVLYIVIPPDDNSSPGDWDIRLFDSMGRQILQQKGISDINELSLSGVKNGYYILRVANKGVRKEWRVVKN